MSTVITSYCGDSPEEHTDVHSLIKDDRHLWLRVAWRVSDVATIATAALSFFLLFTHFRHWQQPRYQRFIARILLMAPVYGAAAWLTLRYPEDEIYFTLARDIYEAFVLYSFFSLLLQYLGPTEAAQRQKMQNKPNMAYPFPFNKTTFNPRGRQFFHHCRFGCMQYFLIVRPITAAVTIALQNANILCPAKLDLLHPQFYLTFINLASVTISMYTLVTFYLVIREDTAAFNPIYKFVAIKFVLFFSFWQAIGFGALLHMGIMPRADYMTAEEVIEVIDNCLICVEMFIAALVYIKAFPYWEHTSRVCGGDGEKGTGVVKALIDALNPQDILAELRQTPADLNASINVRGLSLKGHKPGTGEPPTHDKRNPFEVVNMEEFRGESEVPRTKDVIMGPDIYGLEDEDERGEGCDDDESDGDLGGHSTPKGIHRVRSKDSLHVLIESSRS